MIKHAILAAALVLPVPVQAYPQTQLPQYEVFGFPISPHQIGVLQPIKNIRESTPLVNKDQNKPSDGDGPR